MDPVTGVALAGNILQFCTLAIAVADRLNTYCKADSDIPPIFKELAVQLPLVAEVCKQLEKNASVPPDRLSQVVDGCLRTVEGLQDILTQVTPLPGASLGSRLRKGFKSVGIESKARQCRDELECYKSTLTLFLSVHKPFLSHASLTRPIYHHLPPVGQAKFVGRKALLDAIDRVLKTGDRDTCVAVLLGMGGQGKTSLAIEYCKREKSRKHFETILWINSVSHLTIQRSIAEIAKNIVELSGEKRVFPSSKEQTAFIHGIIESRSAPWLFVFDNYDWPQKVNNILSYAPTSTERGAVIMTTRHEEVASYGTLISVTGMSEIDAVELLMGRTQLPRTIGNLEQAKVVVKVLGYLPLAIDQSAAYIKSRKINPEQFLVHFKNRKETLLNHIPSVWDYRKTLGDAEDETPLGVFTTWEMSFTQAQEHSPIGEHLGPFLTILGFFSPLQIRMEMLKAYYEGLSVTNASVPAWLEAFTLESEWDEYIYQEVMVAVSELSLVKLNDSAADDADQLQDSPGFCTISLHPLVRDWMQLRAPANERRTYAIIAVSILGHYISSAGNDYREWPLKIRLQALSHVDATLELQAKYAKDWASTYYSEVRSAFVTICTFYADNGRYEEAKKLSEEVLRASSLGKGTEADIEAAQLQQGDIYLLQGRYDEVELTMLKLLNSSVNGKEIATKVHIEKNLAKVFAKQGRYDEAANLYHQILEQQATYLKPDHVDILNTKEHLAYVYRNQGLHIKAIELYEALMQAYKAADIEDHLDALHSMVNLANTYRAQAQYDLATALYGKASKGISAKLHADHPTALSTKSFMAINLRELEQNQEAEEAFRDVVERSARVLGLLHPDTLKATMNFAILCDRTGKYMEAEELYRTTLVGREQKLGTDNPYTLRTVERLVSLLWNQRRYDECLAITMKALKAQRRSSLEDQLQSLNLDDPNAQYRPVEILFENACARDVAKLGEAHRDRIETQKSLARVYESRGRSQEARELMQAAQKGEEMLREQLWKRSSQWMGSKETLVEGVKPSPLMLESLPETPGLEEKDVGK
jgi:tetratricopeptide (TPR) repeat protein